MKKFSGVITVIALLLASSAAHASGTASHTVTVVVEPINEVALEGGDLNLIIDTATAGSDPDAVVDGSARLLWTTNERNRKITVATDRVSSEFRLILEALNVRGGSSQGPVELGTTPRDLIVGISTTVGSADLRYTATAAAEAGIGSEVHTISFTITAGN